METLKQIHMRSQTTCVIFSKGPDRDEGEHQAPKIVQFLSLASPDMIWITRCDPTPAHVFVANGNTNMTSLTMILWHNKQSSSIFRIVFGFPLPVSIVKLKKKKYIYITKGLYSDLLSHCIFPNLIKLSRLALRSIKLENYRQLYLYL